MTGNTQAVAAKSGPAKPAGGQTPANARREDDATRYVLFLTQVCIKMFWRSLYAAAAAAAPSGIPNLDDLQRGIRIFGFILLAADLIVQMSLMTHIFDRPYQKPTRPPVCLAGCGVALVFTYNLFFLPDAGSIMDVFRATSWVGFVFNLGCLVELELGLFRRCVVAFSDAPAR